MKKIIAVLAAASMLTTVAFAEDAIKIDPETTIEISAPEFTPAYTYDTVTVTGITADRLTSTKDTEKKDDPNYEVDFILSENTIVLDGNNGDKKKLDDIKIGDKVTVYSDANSPSPLILPPLYQADVIALFGTEDPQSSVLVDVFNKNGDEYLSEGNKLRVVIGDDTEITDVDGNEVSAENIDGKVLAVFYTISTRSIPPLTNPEKIVVTGDRETNDDVEVDFSKIKSVKIGEKTIDNIYISEDGNLMIPLRASLEAKGLSVEWNGERNEVVIEGGKFGLRIGENKYIKGKMMPLELSSAPVLHNDLTYVPLDFYTDVIESDINLTEDSMEISFE